MATPIEPVRVALRKLWSDHVIWTREYIVAAVGDRPEAGAAAERLLRNQDDIGAAIVPYYGQEAGDQLTSLLKEHIMIAVDLVEAAKKGDNDAFASHDRRWSDNAAQIARFLAGANANWPEKDVADLLSLHLKLTKDETVARLQKDWPADIRAFDDIFNEILVLADALHDGLKAQFPDRFMAKAA
jgi:hypothetical protein